MSMDHEVSTMIEDPKTHSLSKYCESCITKHVLKTITIGSQKLCKRILNVLLKIVGAIENQKTICVVKEVLQVRLWR